MHKTVQSFLSAMSEECFDSDIVKLFDRFTTPTMMYVGDEVILINRIEDFATTLERFFGELIETGLFKSLPKINAISIPRKNTVTAWVSCRYENSVGCCIGTSEMKYFFRKCDDTLKIELIECLNTPIHLKECQKPHLALV